MNLATLSATLCIILAGSAGCSTETAPRSVDLTGHQSTCASVSNRAEGEIEARPYTIALSQECQRAVKFMRNGDDVIGSWRAMRYLQELSDFEKILLNLDARPSRYGEYLIAAEVGLNDTLQAWILARGSANLRISKASNLRHQGLALHDKSLN